MFQLQISNKTFHQGLSVIELLIVVAILVTAFVSISGLIGFSIRISTFQKQMTEAAALAQETVEALRNFRDGIAWNNDDATDLYDGLGLRAVGTPYHPVKSSDIPPRWQLASGEDTVNGFKRKILFDNVLRDATDTIASSGTIDPNTRKATVIVSWTSWGNGHQVKIPLYLTKWRE